MGSHDGAFGFTVGQRRGLRIGRPAPDGRPRYVLDIEPVSGTVTVGPAEALDVVDIEAQRPVWSGCPPPAGADRLPGPVARARRAVPGDRLAGRDADALRIKLARAARGVAGGQAAVLYRRDRARLSHHYRCDPATRVLGRGTQPRTDGGSVPRPGPWSR